MRRDNSKFAEIAGTLIVIALLLLALLVAVGFIINLFT